MTIDLSGERHPSDLELAAWVDEPGIARADIRGHLGACARCRDRVAELAATRGAIAQDPPMPSAAEFTVQRKRILAALEASPRKREGRLIRRIGWLVPIAAAAAVAAIVLVDRPERSTPGAGPAPDEVVAEAEAAAEEIAVIANDQALDAALAATELGPPVSIERSAAIEDEFALLSEAEQSAVLRELERTDFDL